MTNGNIKEKFQWTAYYSWAVNEGPVNEGSGDDKKWSPLGGRRNITAFLKPVAAPSVNTEEEVKYIQ